MDCKQAEALLDAYLDNELDPIHAADVDAHLRACPRCAALLNQKKSLQQVLRAHLPYHTAPLSLRRALSKNRAPVNARNWKLLSTALAACLFVSIGALAWSLATRRPAGAPDALLADAIESDHIRSVLSPEHLTDVLSSDQHTVKPWFIGKIPFVPPVHDFAPDGFPLLGGRLDILNHQTIAVLVYGRKKHIINLFVFPTLEPDSPGQATTTARGYHLLHWTDNHFAFWAASDVAPADLNTLSDLIQHSAS